MSCADPTIEAGQACQDFADQYEGDSWISFTVADTAGTIIAYRFQPDRAVPAGGKNVEFSFHTKDTDYSYIDGTESGVITVPASSSGCICFTAGVDFTVTTEASVGDYLCCYYADRMPYSLSGTGGFAWWNDSNVCEAVNQTPGYTDTTATIVFSADITAGGASNIDLTAKTARLQLRSSRLPRTQNIFGITSKRAGLKLRSSKAPSPWAVFASLAKTARIKTRSTRLPQPVAVIPSSPRTARLKTRSTRLPSPWAVFTNAVKTSRLYLRAKKLPSPWAVFTLPVKKARSFLRSTKPLSSITEAILLAVKTARLYIGATKLPSPWAVFTLPIKSARSFLRSARLPAPWAVFSAAAKTCRSFTRATKASTAISGGIALAVKTARLFTRAIRLPAPWAVFSEPVKTARSFLRATRVPSPWAVFSTAVKNARAFIRSGKPTSLVSAGIALAVKTARLFTRATKPVHSFTNMRIAVRTARSQLRSTRSALSLRFTATAKTARSFTRGTKSVQWLHFPLSAKTAGLHTRASRLPRPLAEIASSIKTAGMKIAANFGCPQNLCPNPRGFGSWSKNMTPTSIQDQIGVDGVANIAWTLGDDDAASGEHFLIQTAAGFVANDNNPICFSVFVKKDSDTSRFPGIALILTGGASQYCFLKVNTSTGASSVWLSAGSYSAAVIDYNASWWRVYAVVYNNTSGNTTVGYRVYPAVSTLWTGGSQNAATGTIIVDAAQLEYNSSYPGNPLRIDMTMWAFPKIATMQLVATKSMLGLYFTIGTKIAGLKAGSTKAISSVGVLLWLGVAKFVTRAVKYITLAATSGTRFKTLQEDYYFVTKAN